MFDPIVIDAPEEYTEEQKKWFILHMAMEPNFIRESGLDALSLAHLNTKPVSFIERSFSESSTPYLSDLEKTKLAFAMVFFVVRTYQSLKTALEKSISPITEQHDLFSKTLQQKETSLNLIYLTKTLIPKAEFSKAALIGLDRLTNVIEQGIEKQN